jgi:hypothetical protein
MDINVLVGPVSAGDGTGPKARGGRQGEQIVQDLHGRYYEATFRKSVFSGAAVATTVGLATTHTGLCLTNPIGSNVNLVLNVVGVGELVAPAAAALIGIATGYNAATAVTQTTPITPQNNFVGGGAGAGLLASSVTLPTAPTVRSVFGSMGTAAATAFAAVVDVNTLEGSIIIPPGGYACTYTSTASGAAGMGFSFQWEETPITG